jgi:signal peptidase I
MYENTDNNMYDNTDTQEIKTPDFKNFLKKASHGLYDLVETLVIAFAVVIFIYLFIASPHEVVGSSMEDNFFDGEYLLADKITYHFRDLHRGEVVIFEQTESADYIKRIIGLPGDKLEIRDGSFYVNGERLDESEYLDPGVYTDGKKFLNEGDTYTVPQDKLFVAGDNREHSSDSRAFGPIPFDKVKGRAVLVYWPISHLKIVKKPTYNEE